MRTLAAFACRAAMCLAPALAAFMGTPTALGFDLDPSEIRGKSSKEPVTVLQNRYFLKTGRPEFGLVVGSIMDEAYLETQFYGARTGFFINEWLGVEAQMVRTKVSESADKKALENKRYRPLEDTNSGDAAPDGEIVTVTPEAEVNAIHSMTDFNVVAAPFYGKLNFMNQYIIYTDLCLTAGLSRVETDQGEKTAMILGIGERFYIGKAWSVRIDFRDRIYNEERANDTSRKNSYSVDFGTSYFFN